MKIIDMHCDTIHKIWKEKHAGECRNLLSDDNMLSILKMEKGSYSVQNFAMFIEAYDDDADSKLTDKVSYLSVPDDSLIPVDNNRIDCFNRFEDLYMEFIDQMSAYSDRIAIVTNVDEIYENERQERLSALLTVEGGEACQGDIDKLYYLYDKGVRMMTLTWNYINELGYPNINIRRQNEPDFSPYIPDTEHGLTDLGVEFVKAMEDMGMIIDVSHLSDAGFYDVFNNTKKPFVASHSNARTICPCVRNLTDDMIRKLGERGGVTGLNYCRDFLFTKAEIKESDKENTHMTEADACHNAGEKYLTLTCDKIAEHAKHIVNAGGMEVLGLGSDFDGIPAYRGMPKADKMEYLAYSLHKAGFSDDRIEDIFYKNVMRVYKSVL